MRRCKNGPAAPCANAGEKDTVREERPRAKAMFERRVDALISSYSSSEEKNCRRFVKRLKREGNMLFLEEEGVDITPRRGP